MTKFALFAGALCGVSLATVVTAQDFAACVVDEENIFVTNHKDHGLGYVSYETKRNQTSIQDITYRFEDCSTGRGLDISFIHSQRKKKTFGGQNAVAVELAIRTTIEETNPSWTDSIIEVENRLLEQGVQVERVSVENDNCACVAAYPNLQARADQ